MPLRHVPHIRLSRDKVLIRARCLTLTCAVARLHVHTLMLLPVTRSHWPLRSIFTSCVVSFSTRFVDVDVDVELLLHACELSRCLRLRGRIPRLLRLQYAGRRMQCLRLQYAGRRVTSKKSTARRRFAFATYRLSRCIQRLLRLLLPTRLSHSRCRLNALFLYLGLPKLQLRVALPVRQM